MSNFLFSPRWSTLSLCSLGLAVAAAGYFGGRQLGQSTGGAPTPSVPPNRAETHVAASSATTASAMPGSWEERWEKLSTKPSSPARTRELASLVEKLARTDPKKALSIAFGEANWQIRDELRNAALRGWGATAPDAAADWAMNNRLDVRMHCVAAVLQGAAENPAEAARVALRICKADPEPAADYGHALISALVDKTGSFEAATKFAVNVGTERHQFLLDSAYYQWARYQPEQALAALSTISDPKIRNSAFDGLLAGWANADARQLAEYAQTMAPGDERTRAFNVALPRWVEKDPASATEWLGRLDPSRDLDQGIGAVASLPSLITRNPETAMDWSDNIVDNAYRLLVKNEVITQWAHHDYAAARRFAESVKNPAEREMMIEALNVIKPAS